ncbi:MAG: response regulator, partial [Hypericibacter sp.]
RVAARTAELAQAKDQLRLIIDTVLDAVVTIDRRGVITGWNPQAEAIFGWQAADVLGRRLSETIIPPHRRAVFERAIERYPEPSEALVLNRRVEVTRMRRDGLELPVELAVTALRVGEETIFSAFLRDITERKRAEQEIIRAREEAEAATRAKSYFLATMSHEIRTPMNGVLGMASLLASTPLGERQKHLVASLSRSGRALLAVINDVLDFSKIEAGQLTLVEMDFDVREVAAEVIDMFGERCASKGLELVYFVAEEVPSRLRGDPVRLRQILINLVGNSLKFTERGEILVEVTVAAGGPGHTVLDFAVKDTGIGIAPEDHARIFESFHQIDNSMTRSRGGTGLGLAISRQLVEMMGGKIMLESELGRGSRFHFSVRCDQLAEPEGADRIVRRIERPLRTLLVDTNALSAHVLSLYLSNWTIDVEQASTVAEAEAALHDSVEADRGFDVVILDLKGLGAPGVALARQIRSGAKPAELILMIGFDGWLTDDTLDMLHAFATLTKPVRPSVLFDCLASIASGSRENGVAPFFIRAASEGDRHHFAAQVLVVEDNPVNREVATGILENMGCHVITAPNGTHAIQRLAQEQVDLILMDCEMPEMDGFEATKRIRDLENLVQGQPGTETSRQRVPIIALTAHALADIREKCLKSGMDDFLVKPFDERQLGEALGRWLPPRQGGMSSSIAETPPPEVPAAAAAFSAIDGSVIDSVRTFKGKNGRELLKRIVMQFTENAPAVAATIRTATIAGEPETAWRAAHGLKSSAAALGAMRLSRSCAKIETLARETGIESVRDLLDELDAEVAAAVHGLTQLSGDTHAA